MAALDLGEAYTGVAVSDPGCVLARPLEVVPSGELEAYLRGLVDGEGVSEVLVGVPRTLGGEVGFQARRVLNRLGDLREDFPAVRFVEWDERLTTRLARSSKDQSRGGRQVGRRGGSRGKSRGRGERVDHLAAAGMLQEYLDRGRTVEAIRR